MPSFDPERDELTPRERKVLGLIARGNSHKDLGRELSISVRTVESDVSAVLRERQLSTRHEPTRWANERRLLIGCGAEASRRRGRHRRPYSWIVQIRTVAPEEHDRAGEVVLAAYRSLPGEHLSHDYAHQLTAVGRRATEAEVLVAVDDGTVVGCVTLVPDASSPWSELLQPGEAGIRMLAVDPTHQGRGTGRALVEACVGRARALNRAAVVLHSTPWMLAAHRLYEHVGFTRLPERDFEPVPGVPLRAFRLELVQPQ